MAEKAKAKKSKALTKKTSTKAKKREEKETVQADAELLELQAEVLPKRGARSKAAAPAAETKATPVATIPQVVAPEVPVTKIEPNSPIQPRVAVQKPEPRVEAPRHEPRHESRHDSRRNDNENDGLRLRLSQSLTKKLKEQAADEGISLEEFVGELLAESVVLRAWEIVERKNAMKGHSGQGQGNHPRGNHNHNNSMGNQGNRGNGNNNNGPRGNGNNPNNQGNKGHRGMSHVRYQTIMDDKATFLEYVRAQEKSRR